MSTTFLDIRHLERQNNYYFINCLNRNEKPKKKSETRLGEKY